MGKVLVLGQGGREHAIAYKMYQEGHTIYLWGNNVGVATFGICIEKDLSEIEQFCETEKIDLVFVGPEIYLVDGIVDRLKKSNIKVFGPSKLAAQLEGSKVFAKMMMEKYDIPSAKHRSFDNYEAAKKYLETQSFPIVIKADGLAAGKGVVIPQTKQEALNELDAMMNHSKFKTAGTQVVIEEFLEGEEFSLMCFVSNRKVYPMEIAQDHKRAFDGDQGLNTGGMGAYAPVSQISKKDIQEGIDNVIQPIVDAMSDEGMPFYGILYAGLMKTKDGVKTIEFNVRFGDPECEVLLMKLDSSLYDIAMNIIDERDIELKWKQEAIIGVVLATKGYPEHSEKGAIIHNLSSLSTPVFHMGTALNDNGDVVVNGGRVLLVVASAKTIFQAKAKVYAEIEKIQCDELFYRKDIGYRALKEE